MDVYRMHIRPTGGKATPAESFAYCLEQDILGMGWGIHLEPGTKIDWDGYLRQASKRHGEKNLSRVRYLHDNVQEGDLIWTRDTDGRYYLGRVRSPWQYRETPEGVAADILNFVECDLREVGSFDRVPGKIVACFRPSRTIQSINNATAVRYSKLLWNRLAGSTVYKLEPGRSDDIFDLLGAKATEDVVFLYLQTKGWLILPGTRKADTMGYEFALVRPDEDHRALVQVKTGGSPVPVDTWASFDEKIFVFQPKGLYRGTPSPNVTTLPRATIESFLTKRREILPEFITLWLDYLDENGAGLPTAKQTA